MPSFGFGISEIDVSNAARKLGLDIDLDEADRVLGLIDQVAVERAALKHANDLDEQTDAAVDDIVRQLRDMGYQGKAPSP